MAGKKTLWMLGIFCVLALGAFAFWRWYFLPARERAATLDIQRAASLIPTDLIAVVGTVGSADANGISVIVERYEQSPSGQYLAHEERRFRFVPDSNIFLMLRTPAPESSPVIGEALAEPLILVGVETLSPGSAVTVLCSAADPEPVPVAWRVYAPEP